MSVAQIIQELTKLTPEQRSVVRRRLLELDEQDGGMFLHESADAMFRDMDKEESRDARRKTR